MSKQHSLLLIGAGNMGGALFASWAQSPVIDKARSAVVDPNPTDRVTALCEKNGIAINPEDDGDGYDLCVLGVKPQMFADVIPGVSFPNMDRTLFMSIAAGKSIESIRQLLKTHTDQPNVVRAMPNLPAAVGKGVTLLCADKTTSDDQKAAATALFEAAGAVVWAEDEDQLNRLTGLSGSGPAYVFLLAEAMEEVAKAHGASPEDARLLGEMTLIGAAYQLEADERPAAEMRKAVTSPGGTTAAGLSVLDEKDTGFRPLMAKAIEKAYARAKELSD